MRQTCRSFSDRPYQCATQILMSAVGAFHYAVARPSRVEKVALTCENVAIDLVGDASTGIAKILKSAGLYIATQRHAFNFRALADRSVAVPIFKSSPRCPRTQGAALMIS